jgi:hypothetical protein
MDWPMYRRVERQARRMHEVMARLDVDPLALARDRSGDTYAEARRRCLLCGSSDQCLRWLEGTLAKTNPDFCPNLRILTQHTRQRPAT